MEFKLAANGLTPYVPAYNICTYLRLKEVGACSAPSASTLRKMLITIGLLYLGYVLLHM